MYAQDHIHGPIPSSFVYAWSYTNHVHILPCMGPLYWTMHIHESVYEAVRLPEAKLVENEQTSDICAKQIILTLLWGIIVEFF